jgi:drug/metabolite transporter (DMT)-like permease
MNIERKSSLYIIFACLLWALDLLVRYPVTLKMSFESIVFLESLIGLLFISPWMIKNAGELKKLSKKDWVIAMFIGGIGMSVAGYLQTVCIQKATPGLFSFFQIFQPLFVIYVAHLFLKEKVDNMYVYWGIWVVLSALLMFSVDLELMLASEIVFTDILIALSTMLIWGLCTVLGKKFLKNHSSGTLVFLRWGFAFLFSSIILLMEGKSLPVATILEADTLIRFVFMGAVAGIVSMLFYYRGLREIEAGKVSFIEISYSAFGMIFSAIYTFEGLTFFQMIGAVSFFAFLVLFLSRPEFMRPAIRAR